MRSSDDTNLRGDVIGCTAERFGGFVTGDAFLAHSKVRDLDVAILIEQNVVQLQISVDDAPAVKVEETDRYFGSVESRNDKVQCSVVK